ncbi:hypothetical protein Dsin_023134 [Dipteronia sinensis]|uniref:F-box domain-containing protein n=1 Tax=Dipteronia sinensis TaxID=43782 RepID=A0AAE0E0R4_9ROSI|nr:hypothetical protein Dsin_023134 [Dipteronia sinensis]
MSVQEVQQLSAKKKRSSHQQEEEEEEPSAKKKRIDTTISDLPRDVLPIIFRKLTDHDMLVCAQVCVTWESEVRMTHNQNPPHKVHLLNPFSGQRIELPPSTQHLITTGFGVIMSANPSDAAANCLFLAIFHSRRTFGICRQGQKSWTSLDFHRRFQDVIFYKGALYGVDICGDLCHLICGLKPEAISLNKLSPDTTRTPSKYLVELNGDLLLVERLFSKEKSLNSKEKNLNSSSPPKTYYRDTENTYRFIVLKFDWGKKQWSVMRSLGNYAVLLGMFSSISLPVKLSRYFKSNCIYFIDDSNSSAKFRCEFPDHNTGLYEMSAKHIERLYQSSHIWKNQLRWFRPRL